MRTIKLTRLDGMMCVTEHGGSSSPRDGKALIVATSDGLPVKPVWQAKPNLACGDHAYFKAVKGMLLAEAWRRHSDVIIEVRSILDVGDMPLEFDGAAAGVALLSKPVAEWRIGPGHGFDPNPSFFRGKPLGQLVVVTLGKVKCYRCRHIHYVDDAK